MESTEDSPLLRHRVVSREDAASFSSAPSFTNNNNERRINILKTGFVHIVCILVGYLLNTSHSPLISSLIRFDKTQYYSEQSSSIKILGRPKTTEPSKESESSSYYYYTQVQTISFQIYTGGAPAFINTDESSSGSSDNNNTNKKKNVHQNPECKGCESIIIFFCYFTKILSF
jgi:hypothetical protein